MAKFEVPKGWKLVPDGIGSLPYEMFEAGKAEFKRIGGFNPYTIYKAMLAAAPEPPEIDALDTLPTVTKEEGVAMRTGQATPSD